MPLTDAQKANISRLRLYSSQCATANTAISASIAICTMAELIFTYIGNMATSALGATLAGVGFTTAITAQLAGEDETDEVLELVLADVAQDWAKEILETNPGWFRRMLANLFSGFAFVSQKTAELKHKNGWYITFFASLMLALSVLALASNPLGWMTLIVASAIAGGFAIIVLGFQLWRNHIHKKMEKEIAAAKAAASSIVSQDEKKSADKQSKPPEEPTIENLQGNAKWRQLTPELRKKIIDLHHVTKELWIAFGGSLIFGSVFGATTYAIATSIAVVAAFFPPLLLIGLAGIFLGAIATFAFFKLSAMAINNNKMQTMNAVYKELDIRPIENPYSTNSAGLVATSTFVGATSAAAQPIIPPPLFFIGAIAAAVAFVANFLTAGYLKKRAKQRVELVSEVKEKLKNSADSLTHPIHNSAVDVSSSLTPTEEENNQLIAIYTKTKNHVEGIKKPPGPDNTLRDTSMLGIH